MQNVIAYRSDSAVKHVSPASPAIGWPPSWLAKAKEIAQSNPLPPVQDDLPELAAWDEITVEEIGDPCPKCGSLEKWWDFNNKAHCQQCKPLRRAFALADLAARLRRKAR